ncbi:NF-kappa-B-repressing factor-like [Euwallacea similis]|uniref:NF-kappa-B-repressing factor-like n=1 Tax=Euwallacea similis TaxID=1736056 RepID=UPI00344C3908
MEHNRLGYNRHNPYERRSPHQNRNHRPEERRLPQQNTNQSMAGRCRGHYYNHFSHQHRNNKYPRRAPPWQNYYCERTFDSRGRELENNQACSNSRQTEVVNITTVVTELSPLELKAKSFLDRVLTQEGVRAKLIFLQTIDNAIQTLQGAADNCQLQMIVEQCPTGEYVLKIGQEDIVRGSFSSKQLARHGLAEQALVTLKKDCFYIAKKNDFEEVLTKEQGEKEGNKSQHNLEGSKAHQMMLKMGWGGKGLGVNEQGEERTVAETIDQNVSRQGLGVDNVFKKIHSILEDYTKSDKISLLKFDPNFTSEERAHIHKIASKFGLKSKSEGKGDQRRITITKKLNRDDLVYNLLTSGLENALYKLEIPSKFAYLWDHDEDNKDAAFQPNFLTNKCINNIDSDI